MAITSEQVYLLNRMNSISNKVQLGTLLNNSLSSTATLSGTTLIASWYNPTASVATAGVNLTKLFMIGDGNLMGDAAKPTYGFVANFARTIATSSFSGFDTAADIRMSNALVNVGAYAMQGMYIKCKNSTGGTVQDLRGLFVETVASGTDTTAVCLKLGSDGTAIDSAIDMSTCVTTNGADIKLSSGITIGSGADAPTHAAATGSIYIRTGQSDQKAMLYLCTVASGTWVLLNTVTV